MVNGNKKIICPAPFIQAFIYPDGRVFCCPDCMTKAETMLGNLNDNTFEVIWFSSPKRKELQKRIQNGDYSSCFKGECFAKTNFHLDVLKVAISKGLRYNTNSYPQVVTFGIDYECNVACAMCRKGLYHSQDDELDEIKTKIEKIYLPILKDTSCVCFSTTSDPFASKANRYFIKRITETLPNITFSLMTNGILCDKFNCDRLGITDKLDCLTVSIHAATEDTYNSVVKNGNWSKVNENLLWLKSMKENRKIKYFNLAFVISSRNFQDIQLFVDFAKSYGANARFWNCVSWGDNLEYSDENLQIMDEKHPKHNEFAEIIKNTDFSDEHCLLSPRLNMFVKSLQN